MKNLTVQINEMLAQNPPPTWGVHDQRVRGDILTNMWESWKPLCFFFPFLFPIIFLCYLKPIFVKQQNYEHSKESKTSKPVSSFYFFRMLTTRGGLSTVRRKKLSMALRLLERAFGTQIIWFRIWALRIHPNRVGMMREQLIQEEKRETEESITSSTYIIANNRLTNSTFCKQEPTKLLQARQDCY